MVAAGEDADVGVGDLVDETMLVVDAFGSAAGEFVLERFGLADAAERIGGGFLDEAENSQRLFAILLDPPSEIVNGSKIKYQASDGLRQARRLRVDSWLPGGACASRRS